MEATETTRCAHLEWCKDRALAICATGDFNQAYASMASDLEKHTETKGHVAIRLGVQLLMNGSIATQADMAKFIEGFN